MKKVCFILPFFLLQCAFGKNVPLLGECPTPQSFRMARFDQVFFQFQGEFLYWKTDVKGLEYGVTYLRQRLPNVEGTSFNLAQNTEEKKVNLEKDSGYRLTGGLNIPHIEWDASFSWTHFKTKGEDRVDEEIFAPGTTNGVNAFILLKVWETAFIQAGSAVINTVEYLSATQEFKYDTADWELGESYKFHDWVYFRPFFGLRGAWVKNKLQIFSQNTTSPNQLRGSDMSLTNNFSGGGPRFGVGSKLSVFEILGIYATASTSILYGNFNLKEIELFSVLAPNSGSDRVDASFSRKMVKPSFQLNTGMEIGYTFKANVKIEANLDYELNYWPNQIQLMRFLNYICTSKSGGDIMLHGLLVGGSIYY